MKIVSDNPALLEKIHKELKLAGIKVNKETKVVDGAMAGEILTAIDLLNFYQDFQEYKGYIDEIIGGVYLTGKYLKSEIKVELKDGTIISYEEYENMSDKELSKAFLK